MSDLRRAPRRRRNPSRNPSRRALALAVFAAVSVVGVAIAEEITITRPVDVLEDKTAASDIVETIKAPDKLTVLAHEDKWLHVQTTDGKQGYVSAAVMSASTGSGALNLTGGPTASEMSAGNAGKGGIDSNVTGYASTRGLSTTGLQKMIAIRKAVSGADYKKFTTDGNVGPNHN